MTAPSASTSLRATTKTSPGRKYGRRCILAHWWHPLAHVARRHMIREAIHSARRCSCSSSWRSAPESQDPPSNSKPCWQLVRTMKTKRSNNNDAAIDAYIGAQGKAQDALKRIADAIQAHQDSQPPEAIHRGHVGDLNHVVEMLAEIEVFLSRNN